MPKTSTHSEQDIIDAACELDKAGKPATNKAVRAALGTVSSEVVCRVLREWREKKNLVAASIPLPPSLVKGLQGLIEDTINQTDLKWKAAIEAEKNASIWSEEQIKKLEAEVYALGTESDQLRASCDEWSRKFMLQSHELDRLSKENQKLELIKEKHMISAVKLSSDLDRARRDLEVIDLARNALDEQAKALQTEVTMIRSERDVLSGQNSALSKSLELETKSRHALEESLRDSRLHAAEVEKERISVYESQCASEQKVAELTSKTEKLEKQIAVKNSEIANMRSSLDDLAGQPKLAIAGCGDTPFNGEIRDDDLPF